MAKRAKTTDDASSQLAPLPAVPTVARGNASMFFLIAAALCVLLFLGIYYTRLDRVVGLVVDDAWYVLLAKALATGQGYTLINSPTAGIRPFYPPVFPFLLSLLYRISPSFPGNLSLLKSLSIIAMLATGLLTFFYFARVRRLPRWLALGLATTTALYPALAFLATSTVMSECLFIALQLGAIYVLERGLRDQASADQPWRFAVPGGILLALAFLTRSLGIGLVVAALVYLFAVRRQQRAGLIVTGTLLVLTLPWVIYSQLHQPTQAQRDEQRANIVQPYSVQLWQRVAGQPQSGTITLGDLPARAITNLTEIMNYDVGGVALYPLFRPLEPGLPMRIGEGKYLSIILSLLALFGYLTVLRWQGLTLAELVVPATIAVTLLWGWEQYRLLLPLVPFLLFYLVMGVHGMVKIVLQSDEKKDGARHWLAATALAWLFVLINVYANYQFIERKNDPSPVYGSRWQRAFAENESLLNYCAQNLPKEAVIATQNPALMHLYTNHKTVASDEPAQAWENWKQLGIRYLVRTSPFPLPADPNENKFNILYRHPGELNLRIVDLGEPASRPAW